MTDEQPSVVRYTRAQADRVGAHQDNAVSLADAVQAHAEPLACQVCGKPAKRRNISGFEDVLCDGCYQSRLSMENDHWNN